MVEITVRGEAVERVSAERATVTVQSRWSAPKPDEAMDRVARAHADVVAAAKEHEASGAAESWHADRAWLSHHDEWVGDGRSRRRVHTASASVTVRFVDVDALGRWLGELGADPVHELGGVQWSLTDESQRASGRAARSRAIGDALSRAADYAAAAGLGAPVIDAIREPGTTFEPVPSRGMARMESFAVGAADAGGARIELSAGEIEVVAEVEVRCTAEPQRHIA